MHLTEVGGALRQRSAEDPRLASIFPKGPNAKARRPRLSEFLCKEELRPYFRVQESKIRQSEKVRDLKHFLIHQQIPAARCCAAALHIHVQCGAVQRCLHGKRWRRSAQICDVKCVGLLLCTQYLLRLCRWSLCARMCSSAR